MKHYFISMLIAFFSLGIFAQSYEGTIGSNPIFIEIDTDYNDNGVRGLYFYKSQLKNINLEGRKKGNIIILYLEYGDEKDNIELFTLKINENKLFGTWQDKAKNLPVALTLAKQNSQKYKQQNFSFNRDSVVTYNKKELVWFTEKYSKKSLFRLGNGFTKTQRNFLNPKLDSIHFRHAEMELECGVDQLSIDVKSISSNYVSILESYSIYCSGAAHPNYGQVSYNFDIKKNVELQKITAIFPNLDYYTKLKNKYKDNSEYQEECEYFNDNHKDVWEYCSWFLTKQGVTIIPQYPHAMTPCEEEFMLTYEEIKQ